MSLLSWTKEYGGYIPGIYIVLHTFGSDIKFNPHFHILITAGGLSLDHKRWIHAPENFIIPDKGVKKRWRYNVIKKMGIFTFITYLSQHIPDKYFRVVRPYGIFSNRLRGTLLPKARILLAQTTEHEKPSQKNWRERQIEYNDKDPLICENWSVEMNLVFVCYGIIEYDLPSKLGLKISDRIPSTQFQFVADTS